MNGEARREDGPHTQTPPTTVAVAPDGLGEPSAELELLRLPDETEDEWRRRLAARGVRLVPAPDRDARRQALAEIARLHDPAVTLDRCAVAGDGTLVVYDRPVLQPGARRHRTFTPDVVGLRAATRAALERAGLIVLPDTPRTPPRRQPARRQSRRHGAEQTPATRGDPPPGPSRRRRGATLRLLLGALVRESSLLVDVERPARAAWEVAP